MTEPLQFPSVTPRHSLPLLFSGQAQREAFLNEALSLCDALLHPAIKGEAATPPTDPEDGDCWLVGVDATGEFSDRAGQLACRQAGQWLYAVPRSGMCAFDLSTGQQVVYAGAWRRAATPPPPAGGANIDEEARVAINQLIAVLVQTGVLPQE
ncbi:DUF2793 domain-containing protein [Tsuneonella sp. HG249]